ncbi:MAG: outer membrane beta-barrel protein [Deltaproteobacteria bacterium]|nr:outer membrane beta-barrel protein [Deltaproteobacteria bacterium]
MLVLPYTSRAAGNIMILPSIQIKDGYDSNINFSKTDEEEDFYTIVGASFALDYAAALLNLSVGANLDVVRYAEEEQKDYESYGLGFNGNYQIFERSQLNFNLSFDDDITLRSELEETGLVYIRSERQRYSAGGGFSHQVSELSRLGVSYTYTKTEYDWEGNVDYTSDAIAFEYIRTLSNQRDTITITPNYYRTKSIVNEVDNYGLSFNWGHAFSETFNLNIKVGGRYTKTQASLTQPLIVFDPTLDPPFRVIYTQEEKSDSNWGVVADLSVEKIGERYSTALGYNHDLSYSSLGQPTERDKIYFSGSLMLSERLTVGLSGSLYFNNSESESYDLDSRYYEMTSYLSYQLTKNGSFRIEYTYANDKDFTLTGDDQADRHNVLISLTFGFPKEL